MSWDMVKLGDVCDISIGRTPSRSEPKYWGSGYNWLSIADMNQGKYIHKTKEQITDIAVKETKINLVPSNTVLYSFKLSIGKISITTKPIYTNEAIAALTIKDKNLLSNKFLTYVLASVSQSVKTDRAVMGATLNKSKLNEITFPLPPLQEQQRIADILDKAEAINQKREQALALCDEFLRATFLDMFGDPVSNPKKWNTKQLRCFGEIITGGTPSRSKPEYYGNHIEWIKSDNINTPNSYITRAKEFLSVKGEKVARSVPENSVLMTCIAGSLDCIGNIAITDKKVAFNQQINGIIPNDEVEIFFLYSLLLYSKKYIQNHSTNSMKGMISKGKLAEIVFYLPKISLQKEYSDIFIKVEGLKNKIQQAQELPLFDALSQKAFKGELTQ